MHHMVLHVSPSRSACDSHGPDYTISPQDAVKMSSLERRTPRSDSRDSPGRSAGVGRWEVRPGGAGAVAERFPQAPVRGRGAVPIVCPHWPVGPLRQETVIFSMGKSVAAPGATVRVETRSDHLSDPHEVHDVAHDRIVSPGDAQRFINLPGSPDVTRAAAQVAALPADLQSLGLVVSTGPVVEFRSRRFLTAAHAPGSVPLIYPSNVKSDGVQWPLATRKPQGLVVAPETQRQLFPNGCYVLVKRFTAKEEKRRVVAGVYDPVDGYGAVAFENHLNVIYRGPRPAAPPRSRGPSRVPQQRPGRHLLPDVQRQHPSKRHRPTPPPLPRRKRPAPPPPRRPRPAPQRRLPRSHSPGHSRRFSRQSRPRS